MDDLRTQTIREIAEPFFAERSVELVELAIKRQGRNVLVRMIVDKPGGVTVQDCSKLNQIIGKAIDESGSIEEDYTLEVSSPGLDRPIVSKRDFERAIGEELRVQLKEPIAGTRQPEGMLLAVGEESVVLKVSNENIEVAFEKIEWAKKKISW